MSRIRTIKPEFWTSEQVVSCSLSARLLFIGLWCFCDDHGVHPASCKRLKMEIFPGDSFTPEEIDSMITELVAAGLLVAYVVEGQEFLKVTGWERHQKIDKPTYRYPLPKNGEIVQRTLDDHSTTIRRPFDDHSTSPPRTLDEPSGTEWSLMESNGVESNGSSESSEKELGKPNSLSSDSDRCDFQKKKINRKRKPYSPKFEEFWQTCPPRKRGGKKAASEAYARAVDRLRGIQDDPHAFLLARFSAYWASPLGQTQYANGPAPWLNQGHYDDDPAAWERDDGEDISGLVLQFDN